MISYWFATMSPGFSAGGAAFESCGLISDSDGTVGVTHGNSTMPSATTRLARRAPRRSRNVSNAFSLERWLSISLSRPAMSPSGSSWKSSSSSVNGSKATASVPGYSAGSAGLAGSAGSAGSSANGSKCTACVGSSCCSACGPVPGPACWLLTALHPPSRTSAAAATTLQVRCAAIGCTCGSRCRRYASAQS